MENFNEVNLSRRNFVKGALAAGGAVALSAAAPALKPFEAFAAGSAVATGDMVVGTKYAVTVNPIVPATVHNSISFDAVITDTTTPSIIPYRRPTTRQSNNGTIVKNGDGSFTVSVATFNNTFGLLTIADDSNDGGAHVTGRNPYAWNVGGNASRIDGLTVKIDSAVSGMGKYVFSATEYANFMNVGAQSWPVTLEVSFNEITIL